MGKDDKEEIPINQAGGLCTEWNRGREVRTERCLLEGVKCIKFRICFFS